MIGQSILVMAPKYWSVVAHLKTLLVENLAKAQTATNVIGIEHKENDMAQRFTGMDERRPYAS